MEEHWTRLGDEELARERAIVNLASVATAAGQARLPAGSGHTGGDVVEILQRIRRDAPDDPFWRGIREVRADDSAAAVSFHEALVPRPIVVGDSRVECHLHDEAALERAREARDSAHADSSPATGTSGGS